MSAELLDSRPMAWLQIMVVTICIALITVEGYDMLAMSFAVSGIVAEFGLGPSQLGVLPSSGLFGMALGSALIAPLADRIGRRRLFHRLLVRDDGGHDLWCSCSVFGPAARQPSNRRVA